MLWNPFKLLIYKNPITESCSETLCYAARRLPFPFFSTPNAMVMSSDVFHVWKYTAFVYWYHKSANSHSNFFLNLWKPLRCPMTCITNQSLPVWSQSSTTSTEDKLLSSLYSSLTSALCSFCCVEDSIFQCQW